MRWTIFLLKFSEHACTWWSSLSALVRDQEMGRGRTRDIMPTPRILMFPIFDHAPACAILPTEIRAAVPWWTIIMSVATVSMTEVARMRASWSQPRRTQ